MPSTVKGLLMRVLMINLTDKFETFSRWGDDRDHISTDSRYFSNCKFIEKLKMKFSLVLMGFINGMSVRDETCPEEESCRMIGVDNPHSQACYVLSSPDTGVLIVDQPTYYNLFYFNKCCSGEMGTRKLCPGERPCERLGLENTRDKGGNERCHALYETAASLFEAEIASYLYHYWTECCVGTPFKSDTFETYVKIETFEKFQTF